MNGRSAHKLLDRMRRTSSGWGQNDFERLLTGFGFEYREGKKHRFYFHKDYKDLWISVPRHNSLKEWVARDAVELIDSLQSKEREGTNGKNA